MNRGLTRTTTLLALITGAWVAGCGGTASDAEARRLYVTSGVTDEVWILDARTGEEIDRRSVDRRFAETDEPHGVAFAPDGRHWYTTVSHGQPTLWKYETEGDRLVGRVDLESRGASRIGIAPDGATAFVPDYLRDGTVGQVTVVRLHDLVVLDHIDVCPAPHDAVVSPDGSQVAITCSMSDELLILDARTFQVVSRFLVGEDEGLSGSETPPRYRPMNLQWDDSGDRLYVTLMASSEVAAFDVTGTLLSRTEVGDAPAQIALHGEVIVTANRGSRSLSVLDRSDGLEEVARIDLPGADHPHGVALGAAGEVAYVAYEGTVRTPGGVVAVDLPARAVLWQSDFGAFVLGVALGPER